MELYDNPGDKGLRLRKEVGLLSSIALLLGCLIGTGIYLTPGEVLKNSGSIGASLVIWTIAGLAGVLGGVCNAELGALLPSSGGDYACYVAAGKPYGRYGDIVAFLYSWSSLLILDPIGMALQGYMFSSYVLDLPFAGCRPSYSASILVTLLYITLVSAVNCFSVNMSARVQDVFSALKCVLLLSIVTTGAVHFFKVSGNTAPGPKIPNTSPTVGGLASGLYSALFAYSGWRVINNIAEEIKNPQKNLPIAIIAAMLSTTVIYLLVNGAFYEVLGFSGMASSEAVAVTFASVAWGTKMAVFVPLAISVTLFGTTCGQSFSNSRLLLAAARQGHLPTVLSFINVKSRVPTAAMLARGLVAIVFALSGSVNFLIETSVFIENAWDIGSVSALLLLRRSLPNMRRPFRVPTCIAWIRLLVCVAVAVAPLTQGERYLPQYGVIFGTVLCGVAYYFTFVRFRLVLPGAASVTSTVQKCLNSAACYNELDRMLTHGEERA